MFRLQFHHSHLPQEIARFMFPLDAEREQKGHLVDFECTSFFRSLFAEIQLVG